MDVVSTGFEMNISNFYWFYIFFHIDYQEISRGWHNQAHLHVQNEFFTNHVTNSTELIRYYWNTWIHALYDTLKIYANISSSALTVAFKRDWFEFRDERRVKFCWNKKCLQSHLIKIFSFSETKHWKLTSSTLTSSGMHIVHGSHWKG